MFTLVYNVTSGSYEDVETKMYVEECDSMQALKDTILCRMKEHNLAASDLYVFNGRRRQVTVDAVIS